MSIPDELKESKGRALVGRLRGYAPHFFVPLVVILVGVASFSLGRLSLMNSRSFDVKIVNPLLDSGSYSALVSNSSISSSSSSVGVTENEGQVVGSKNGSVYYLPWCAQVTRIKPENIVRFSSAEMARSQGYHPSTACKGTP